MRNRLSQGSELAAGFFDVLAREDHAGDVGRVHEDAVDLSGLIARGKIDEIHVEIGQGLRAAIELDQSFVAGERLARRVNGVEKVDVHLRGDFGNHGGQGLAEKFLPPFD